MPKFKHTQANSGINRLMLTIGFSPKQGMYICIQHGAKYSIITNNDMEIESIYDPLINNRVQLMCCYYWRLASSLLFLTKKKSR